jgi:hypothetical protein
MYYLKVIIYFRIGGRDRTIFNKYIRRDAIENSACKNIYVLPSFIHQLKFYLKLVITLFWRMI